MARRSGLGRGLGALIPAGGSRVGGLRLPGPAPLVHLPQLPPTPQRLRRGGHGGPHRVGARARRAPAGARAGEGGGHLRADRRRTPVAGGQAGRAPPRSRPSSAPSTTPRRSSRPWWRTSSGRTSTPSTRPPPTSSSWRTSTSPTTSSRPGWGRAGPPCRTLSGCSSSPRPSSAWWPRPGSPPATPGPCSPAPTAPSRRPWPSGPSPRACRSGRWRRRPAVRIERAAAPAPAPGPTRRLRPPGLLELEERLSDHLDTRVKVEMTANRGKVVVEFADLEDLERIYRAMTGGKVTAP